MATLDQLYTLLLATQKDLKNLAKQVRRVNTRFDDPDGSKAKERAKNNGFNRAQRITPELASFLDVPEDEMLSRSAVTRRVNAYIRANELKHPENGRVIMIEKDEKLKALLKVPEDEQLTYLNIQKYLSPHYIKEPPVDPNADPADLNGDGRTTRSEAAEHAERMESPAPAPATESPTPTPAPATASPKKKPVVTKKKPVIRKPVAQA
jgi:upstream activation factor subunit UAF30